MVGLTFCIIMLPSARESRVARAGCRTYTRSTRRCTCRALHSRAPARLCVGRCGRASIAVCRAAAAAVPRFTSGTRRRRHARVAACGSPAVAAERSRAHRGRGKCSTSRSRAQSRSLSRAAAGVRGPPAQYPVQCAPPPECYCAVEPLPAQSRATAGVRRPLPASRTAVARADGDPQGTECPRLYACPRKVTNKLH